MGKREYYEEQKLKKLVYVFSIVLIVSIVIFLTIFVMYNKKLKEDSNRSIVELGKMNDIVSNEELEETSFSSDTSVSNITNTTKEKEKNKNTIKKEKVNTTPINAVVENVVNNKANNSVNKTDENNLVNNEVVNEEVKKELTFMAPVSGEIIKDFATDTLVYSNTLEEWTIHNGIDIKADKMSVVTASEDGIIESIKNDPRYGLTIIIAHQDGFKTIYSNLLTTEFVKENETVEKGQTIATVGESSSFEIADEFHLHFEMYKDGKVVNPTIYLK